MLNSVLPNERLLFSLDLNNNFSSFFFFFFWRLMKYYAILLLKVLTLVRLGKKHLILYLSMLY